LLFPLLNVPLPLPLPVDVVRLLLSPAPPVPFGGAPAELDLGNEPPGAAPLADDAVVDAWLCEPFAIALNSLRSLHTSKLIWKTKTNARSKSSNQSHIEKARKNLTQQSSKKTPQKAP
jgi:hypothetical protein